MHWNREAIPVVAREVVQALVLDDDVDIAQERLPGAATDVAVAMRHYLAAGLGPRHPTAPGSGDREDSLATQVEPDTEERGFEVGAEGVHDIIGKVIESLLESGNVEEVYADDFTLREKILGVLQKHLGISDRADASPRPN